MGMELPISSLYLSLCGILYVALCIMVVRERRSLKVPYGDGGHRMLIKKRAAHSNASEYMPMALLLLAVIEAQGFAPAALIHASGAALFLGRCSHAYAIALDGTPWQFRVYGMMLTLSSMMLMLGTLFGHAINLY